jgi:hypothetical protein
MAVRWNGGSRDGLWSDGGNWTGGQVPGPNDAVIIDLTGTESVLLNTNASILSLSMPEGGVVDMDGHTLATGAGITLGAQAVIAGYGTLDIGTHLAGAGTVQATGLLVLNMTGTVASTIHFAIATNADLKIEGTPTFVDGAIGVGAGNELEIADAATLTLGAREITTGGTIKLDGGTLKDTSGVVLGGVLSGFGTVTTGAPPAGGPAITSDFEGGTVVADGGNLVFTGAVDQAGAATSFTIDNGATLSFDKAVGTTGLNGIAPDITFATDDGTLDLSQESANTYHGALTDFLAGDKIVVAGGNDTVTRIGNDVIEVEHGNTVEAIISLGPNTPGLEVTTNGVTTTITAICFTAGTMIRTPSGEVPVETLQRGDLVCTHEGAAAPVAWLGRQTISTVFADPMRVWPVRIRAGAISAHVPSRDLVLSPGHAILIDGALVLASALVNGTSIVREPSVPETFTYYHVELDEHALILAENTPAETFIDHVERLAFDNWDEHQALYPVGRDIAELPYPVAKSHRQIPAAIRQKLAARAALSSGHIEAVA